MNKKLIIGGVVVVIVAVAIGYVASTMMHSSSPSQQTISDNQTNQPTTPTDNTPTPTTNQNPQSIVFTSVTPTAVAVSSLFTTGTGAHIYKVGTITSGTYAGGDVWFVTAPADGPGSDYAYHFINQNGKITYIAKNSDELYEGDSLNRSKFTVDSTSVLSALTFPSKVSYNNSTFTLDTATNNTATLFDQLYSPSDLKVAFTDSKLGTVYTDVSGPSAANKIKENGFYVKALDGTLRAYSLDIGFYDKDHSLPAITWNDGTSNTQEYVNTDRGGCGARNYASVTSGISMNDLTAVGKTSTGDTVYQLTNSNNAILQNIYTNDYNPYNAPKLSYADFIAARPAFFWFDSFGRIIKFQRADFIPQAECGKPVIYLYPQKTTNVSVKIDPQGGLTKSEPAYNAGWNVNATPNSLLTNTSTGKTYPYLFWEGRGGIYNTPTKGFVIAAPDVHSFLVEKLTKLGLNQKEQADFIEFWEPHMTGAPYFFVTFLGNQDMDNIAPLTISPKPDSVIRVLMDFTPLQKPISVEGYDIKTPTRNGFTVVEWGGVLR